MEEKCKNCRFNNGIGCSAYLNANSSFIKNCLFKDIDLSKKNLTDDEFLIKYEPLSYIKLSNYRRKNKIPQPGDKVITLRAGFSGLGGDIRIVKKIDDKYIKITRLNGENESLVNRDNWFTDIVIVSKKEV